jgi:glycosyltransferase involved in cell wall biosynthesis
MCGVRRVLLISYWLESGGSERQLTEIALGLDRSRYEPHVGTFHAHGILYEQIRSAGVPIVQFPLRSFLHPSIVTVATGMHRYLAKHAIDIVHTFDVPSSLLGVPISAASRAPVVISSQRAYRNLTPGIRHHLLRMTDRIVDGIVVNARAIEQALITEDKVPPDRIHLCYNGIRTDVFFPSPDRFSGAGNKPPTIGSLSVLRPEKSLHTLIEAFARVQPQFPGATLKVIGSGPVLSQLQQLSAQLRLNGLCCFEPATSQVAQALQSIDIFVLPSISEALSNALMEAMACGCAVIASNIGGNLELVSSGENGLIFQAGNAADLADKLSMVLARSDLRRKYAQAAARRIANDFSLTASVERMQNIYDLLYERKVITA